MVGPRFTTAVHGVAIPKLLQSHLVTRILGLGK